MFYKVPQEFIDITLDQLMEKIELYKRSGRRFVNVNGSALPDGKVEMLYTFGDGMRIESIRFDVDTETEVPSISNHFPAAFLFENEIHDLFGVQFSGIIIDYDGELYTLSLPTPMNLASTLAKKSAEQGTYAPDSANVQGTPGTTRIHYPDERPLPSHRSTKL